jgi:hypothetical protein
MRVICGKILLRGYIMKRTNKFTLAIISVTALFMGFTAAMAGKPLDVIQNSNGYPSGAHFNLNIHGKDVDTFSCTSDEGGNSVFISEYGDSKIQYVTNKKYTVTELTVLDPCSESFDGSPAKVQLPYEAQGFYVFARLRAKPANGSINGGPTSIIMSPNIVREACNDTDPVNPDFPDYTQCPDDSLLVLGLIVGNNVYEATDAGFVRFDSSVSTKGKGGGKAKDITSLFMYTGWVYDGSLDTNGPDGIPDGVIDIYDVPMDYDGDDDIDEDDFAAWQEEQELFGLATHYENKWILNIADLVVSEQDISNDGAKLLKVRFYPVATTDFINQ